MVLLVDKYRPKALENLMLHTELNNRMKKVIDSGDFPHILFYGPSGAGKKTRVNCLLRQLYGPSIEKAAVQTRTVEWQLPSGGKKTADITVMSSNYHIELNPSEAGFQDTHVVQEIIKEIAQTQNVNQQRSFKVVVLTEVDRLSKGAQHALRRTMEKYMSTCRIILVCDSACRVTAPLKSRCLGVRVPAPTHAEVVTILMHIAQKEGWAGFPISVAQEISVKSNRNLRKAELMLEACKVAQYPVVVGQEVRLSDWERYIDEMARIILEEQSPSRLLIVRGKLFELLANCIPAEIIVKTLLFCLLRRLDDSLKHDSVKWAAFYEHRLQQGSKPIFHIEAFVAKFMSLYKRWVIEILN